MLEIHELIADSQRLLVVGQDIGMLEYVRARTMFARPVAVCTIPGHPIGGAEHTNGKGTTFFLAMPAWGCLGSDPRDVNHDGLDVAQFETDFLVKPQARFGLAP